MDKRIEYKGKNNPNYRHGKTIKKAYCIDCGVVLSKNAFYYGYKRCLSCSNSESKQGKKHPNYIDGRKLCKYPREFTIALKAKIKKRDSYTCQECRTKKNLSVHHIDYIKTNCTEENLITLCMSCNTKANTNREYFTNKYRKVTAKYTIPKKEVI